MRINAFDESFFSPSDSITLQYSNCFFCKGVAMIRPSSPFFHYYRTKTFCSLFKMNKLISFAHFCSIKKCTKRCSVSLSYQSSFFCLLLIVKAKSRTFFSILLFFLDGTQFAFRFGVSISKELWIWYTWKLTVLILIGLHEHSKINLTFE